MVNGIGGGVKESGKLLRWLQSGNLEFYITGMVVGLILILVYNFII
jgi:NADH-quinone oxidoreductase subunit L